MPQPDRVLLDAAAIAAQNAHLLRVDDSMHDLRRLPAVLERAQIAAWIRQRSRRPGPPLYDTQGMPIAAATLDMLVNALALNAIPVTQPTRFGLVVQRAPLRSFPTRLRVLSSPGDIDIDRFQESALFPGAPVAILHRSGDGNWLFVLSSHYAAWVEKRFLAQGSRSQVLGYQDKTPYRLVTGTKLRTTYTPVHRALSELQLDMGARVPLLQPARGRPGSGRHGDDTQADAHLVDGQNAYHAWTLELPLRRDDGSLDFAAALLPKNTDTASASLPLTRTNIIRQAFKFLGERYGWGHDYNGRDCSGFVSEVYRSMGVWLPRNTGDQANSPALPHTTFTDADTAQMREAAMAVLQVGDMVHIPGHVMLVIGRINDVPWVIHDIHDGQILGTDGQLHSLHLNGVVVTPLPPLMFDASHRFVDRITSIVRIGGASAQPQNDR